VHSADRQTMRKGHRPPTHQVLRFTWFCQMRHKNIASVVASEPRQMDATITLATVNDLSWNQLLSVCITTTRAAAHCNGDCSRATGGTFSPQPV
jgi:hypothetical protein